MWWLINLVCTVMIEWGKLGWYQCFNSSWLNNPYGIVECGSTLVQVMAWCQLAPSQYLNRHWLSSVRYCGIHLRAISWQMLKISIHDMSLKIYNFILHPYLPEANELLLFPGFWQSPRKVNNICGIIIWEVTRHFFSWNSKVKIYCREKST